MRTERARRVSGVHAQASDELLDAELADTRRTCAEERLNDSESWSSLFKSPSTR